MAKVRKPRKGSKGMWPRKRARRIYPSINSWVETDECKPLVFAGYKAGMTQVTMKDLRKTSPTKNQIISAPVTVFDIPPLFVIGARLYRNTDKGYEAVEDVGADEDDVPKDIRKHVHIPHSKDFDEEGDMIRLVVCTQPRRSGLGKKKPEVFEVPLGGSFQEQKEFTEDRIGDEIKVGEVFEEGEFLDSVAITKGKGFQGTVKRYGTTIDRRKDEKRRHIGSMGARGQGRVLHTAPQPGQHGFHRRTDECKHFIGTFEKDEVNPVDGFNNYGLIKEDAMLLKGSTPGPKKRLVLFRKSLKNDGKLPVEIKKIKTSSQQGV